MSRDLSYRGQLFIHFSLQILNELKTEGNLPSRSISERLRLDAAMELANAADASNVWMCCWVFPISLSRRSHAGDKLTAHASPAVRRNGDRSQSR